MNISGVLLIHKSSKSTLNQTRSHSQVNNITIDQWSVGFRAKNAQTNHTLKPRFIMYNTFMIIPWLPPPLTPLASLCFASAPWCVQTIGQ